MYALGRRPRSFGCFDTGRTRRFAPDALSERVYNSAAPARVPKLTHSCKRNFRQKSSNLLHVTESPASPRPGFYEFFCGGGMARVGLGAAWRCLIANDFDPRKAKAYADNWGASDLSCGDVAALTGADLPGRADLAWASFPCQDLSLAGAGAGLSGARSGAFWRFHALMRDLRREGRAPKIIALENVLGALTSKGGGDFTALCRALGGLGYRYGALTIDAAHFVPQSRPRLFVVALGDDFSPPEDLSAPAPSAPFAAPALRRAAAAPAAGARGEVGMVAPARAAARQSLALDRLDDQPEDAPWHDGDQTRALIAAMSKASLRDLAAARAKGSRQVGAFFRRTRPTAPAGHAARRGALRRPRGLPAHARRRLQPAIPDRGRRRSDALAADRRARSRAADGAAGELPAARTPQRRLSPSRRRRRGARGALT